MNDTILDQSIVSLPVQLVDDPTNPMRSQVDDDDLRSLADSIKSHGLIQPISVRAVGGRYEVIAGHRRLAAHRLLAIPFIRSVVFDVDDKEADTLKMHENLFRKDVNPIDQAVFIRRLISRSGMSEADVAAALNCSPALVASRLEILEYPDYLREYLYEGKISLGAAQYLALIEPEGLRFDYCRIAAIRGINVRTAKDWLTQAQINHLPSDPSAYIPSPDSSNPIPESLRLHCDFCGEADNVINLYSGWHHQQCLDIFQQSLLKESVAVDNSDAGPADGGGDVPVS